MVRTSSRIHARSQHLSASIDTIPHLVLVIFLLLLLPQLAASQTCNTDQNPYCKGNSAFEALCCSYPNVCYWSDRDGTPGCCPAGQSCLNGGGGSGGYASYPPSPRPQPTTITSTVTRTTTGQSQGKTVTTTVSNGGGGGGGGAVIVVITTVVQSLQAQAGLTTTTITKGQQQGQTTTTGGGSQTVASTGSTGIGILIVDGAAQQLTLGSIAMLIPAVLAMVLGVWGLD